MKVYIVGGAVRDFLLGRPVKDHDYVVTGATPQEMLDAGFTQVGADFPVFLHPTTKEEYALARTERKTAAGYHGFEVAFDPTVTIEDDLKRRDLTINAMAVELAHWDDYRFKLDHQLLVDPFDGHGDLNRARLHIVSEAFAEDPVRILRTARFQARYGFSQTRETTVAIMAMVKAGEVDALVPERAWTETVKAIAEKRDPLDYFFFLDFHDCRKQWFKQLNLTDQLIANFENVAEMNARQRMAMLTTGFKNADQVGAFFDKLKAPSDFRELAVRTRKLVKLFNTDTLTAEDIDATLVEVSAYKTEQSNETALALSVTESMAAEFLNGRFFTNLETVRGLLPTLADIGFKDLTDEQKATLKGKAVGDALRDLRLAKIEEVLNAS